MSWSGLGKKSAWGTWGLSTRQQLGKCLAGWYESTAWSGFRQAWGTLGPRVLGVAPPTGPVAVRLFIASYMMGGLKSGLGRQNCRSSSRHCPAVIFSVLQLHRARVNGGYYPGYPWEHHQQDGLYGADNGWVDNTFAVDSGKWGWSSTLMGGDYFPITENRLSLVGDPNQLHLLVKLIDLGRGDDS